MPLSDPNTLEHVRRALTLISASAFGAASDGGKDEHYELFLAIAGAADDALKALNGTQAPAGIGAE